MILTLLLQSAVIPPQVAPPFAKTPAVLTRPIEQYDCQMMDESGAQFQLVWRKEGRQGFYSEAVDSRTGKPPLDPVTGKPYALATPETYRIVKDASGRFETMKYVPNPSLGWPGATFQNEAGQYAVIRTDMEVLLGIPKTVTRILFGKGKWADFQVLAGICQVTFVEQKPLERDPNRTVR